MYMLWQSKGQGLDGRRCQGTGARTGRATTISMDRASHLRSPLVMAIVWSPIMLLLLVGLLVSPFLEASSIRRDLGPKLISLYVLTIMF